MFLRFFGAALTKSTVSTKITFVLSVWVLSTKIGVRCSSFYHFETMIQRVTFSWKESFQQLYQLCNLGVQTKSLMKHCLWKKLQSFINFGLWEKISDYRWKKFDSVVEITYYVSRRSVWQDVCFVSNDFVKLNSRSWFESIGTLDDTFLSVLLILHLICLKEALRKINFCWSCNRFCHKFWTLRKYIWPLGVKILRFLCFFAKIFCLHGKKLMVQQKWVQVSKESQWGKN